MDSAENELLTRIGPGTRMGNVLRRYWWPVACSQHIDKVPVAATLLGEKLVLFRTPNGEIGLIDHVCPHRGASLALGRVEERGIRCCYHGWLYDAAGQCLEMPAEPEASRLHEEVRVTSYQVREMGGLIFAYMGPEPAPLLPNYDLLVREDMDRWITATHEHCNWLQRAENGVDAAHSMALHAPVYPSIALKRPAELRWDQTWYGFRMTVRYGNQAENVLHTIFPSHTRRYGARVGERPSHYLHLRVPLDDVTTINYIVQACETLDGSKGSLETADVEIPRPGVYTMVDDGWWRIASHDQDRAAQESQGVIVDRTREFLATSDRGVVLLRRLLLDSLDNVEAGRDPFGLLRDPAINTVLTFDAKKNFMDSDKDYAGNKVEAPHASA